MVRYSTQLVVVCLLLAGCSGFQDQHPTATETITDRPTFTPTPTETETQTSEPKTTPEDFDVETPSADQTPEPAPPANPWQADPVDVTLEDESGLDREYRPQVRSALEYWNDSVKTYTPYNASFSLQNDLSPQLADLNIIITENASQCGYEIDLDTQTQGCYKGDGVIEILPNQTNLQLRNTVIHEVGHALRLEHTDKPRWIMATNGTSVPGSVTDARNRSNPWNTTGTLKLAVGDDLQDRNEIKRELEDVAQYYSTNDHYLPDGFDIEVVDKWYEAHIIVQNSSKTNHIFTEPASVAGTTGLSFDNDPTFESYTRGNIYLYEIDPDDAEPHLGYWVGWLAGNPKDELPARYSS